MVEAEYIAIVGVVIGVLLRTILPYLKKVKESGEVQISFEAKYAATLVISVIVTVITAIEALASMPSLAAANVCALFFGALAFGYAFHSTLNLIPEAA